MTSETPPLFAQMGLRQSLLNVLDQIGYELPTPIQAQTIPRLLEGRDLLGQAQTGTGKTAAFALPLLSGLDLGQRDPQVLVLAPTRELAIQVAEAFKSYAAGIEGFHVVPIYGGQEYGSQNRALARGVQVVVGTPGRVMDHMRRGTLRLDGLKTLVLDEADEMLRMGFIEDVEWILERTPARRQIALFSATLPKPVRAIAARYLHSPAEIIVRQQTATADTIRQRYWPVSGVHKLDALTRILEAEPFTAMLVFVRTKTATLELADRLDARGYRTAPLNGDIAQKTREQVIERLRGGKLDIVVATDVAARGLDVDTISHVINYDIPYDTETYVHRIGRTGRAGRTGDAILFVAPRELRMLKLIEKATGKKVELMELPSTDLVNNRRIEKFKQRITDTLADEDIALFRDLVDQYRREHDVEVIDIAAALARLMQGNAPFLLSGKSAREPARRPDREMPPAESRPGRDRAAKHDRPLEKGMERFRIEVGRRHEVVPRNIVGAIANEGEIDSKYIGRIDIFDDYSLVDLPEGMPDDLLRLLRKVRIAGRRIDMSRQGGNQPRTAGARTSREKPKAGRRKPKKPGKAPPGGKHKRKS